MNSALSEKLLDQKRIRILQDPHRAQQAICIMQVSRVPNTTMSKPDKLLRVDTTNVKKVISLLDLSNDDVSDQYQVPFEKIREIIFKCCGSVCNLTCEYCQKPVTSTNHFAKHKIANDEIVLLKLITTKCHDRDTNQELMSVQVNDLLAFEKYCSINLYPFVDHYKTYYRCPVNKIRMLLTDHVESDQYDHIDDQFRELMRDDQLVESDTVLIDISNTEQNGGSTHLTSEEFGKRIVTTNGTMILPNGISIQPNGKIVEPRKTIYDDHVSENNKLNQRKYNMAPYKFLHDI